MQPQIDEPKPRSWLCKNILEKHLVVKPIEDGKTSKRTCVKDISVKDYDKDELAQAIVKTKYMKIYLLHNLKPKTDLGRTPGKNSLSDRLVKPLYKFAKSVTEISSKVQEPKTYDKAINDSIYGNR